MPPLRVPELLVPGRAARVLRARASATSRPTCHPPNERRATSPNRANRSRRSSPFDTRLPYGGLVMIHPSRGHRDVTELGHATRAVRRCSRCATPARSALARVVSMAPASRSRAMIGAPALRHRAPWRARSRTCRVRTTASLGTRTIAARRVRRPAAMSAASIAIVPEPQKGSTSGTSRLPARREHHRRGKRLAQRGFARGRSPSAFVERCTGRVDADRRLIVSQRGRRGVVDASPGLVLGPSTRRTVVVRSRPCDRAAIVSSRRGSWRVASAGQPVVPVDRCRRPARAARSRARGTGRPHEYPGRRARARRWWRRAARLVASNVTPPVMACERRMPEPDQLVGDETFEAGRTNCEALVSHRSLPSSLASPAPTLDRSPRAGTRSS